MFNSVSSVSTTPAPSYSAPSETAGTLAQSAPSIFSTETAGSIASTGSTFSCLA